MSIEAINWALDLILPPSQKLVVIVLANYADAKGTCWPSFETISQKTSLSRRSVIQQILKLEKLGVLKRIDKHFRQQNIYQLCLSTSEFTSLVDDEIDITEDDQTSESNSPVNASTSENNSLVKDAFYDTTSERGALALVNDVHLTSERGAPKPSYNHHLTSIVRSHKRKRKRKRQLPDDFCVTDAHVSYANKKGLPDPHVEIEKFKNHYLAKGEALKDWSRAFQNWLINAKEFKLAREAKHAAHQHPYRKTAAQRTEDYWDFFAGQDLERAVEIEIANISDG